MRNDCTVVKLSERNEADDEEAIRGRNRSCTSGVGVAQPRSELYVRRSRVGVVSEMGSPLTGMNITT